MPFHLQLKNIGVENFESMAILDILMDRLLNNALHLKHEQNLESRPNIEDGHLVK